MAGVVGWAMPGDSAQSFGVWISPRGTADYDEFDLEDMERFEDTMKLAYSGSYSRSDHIRRAMSLYLAVHDRISDLEEWPDPAEIDDLDRFVAGALKDAHQADVESRDR